MANWPVLFLLVLLTACARSGGQQAEYPEAGTKEPSPSAEGQPQPEQAPESSGALTDSFARGEFQNVIESCRSLQADPKSGALAWCAALVPASLYALGRDGEGLLQIAGACGRMPPASPQSDARAGLIALVMVGLADANRSGHFQRDEARRADMLSSWLEACQVSRADLESVVDKLNRGE